MEVKGITIRVKLPTFDGKTSSLNYSKQFAAAAKMSSWTVKGRVSLIVSLRREVMDFLQTLPQKEVDN